MLRNKTSRRLFGDNFEKKASMLDSIHPIAKLFEFMPDVCFFVKDKRGAFISANKNFIEMLGRHHISEVMGKTDYDFFPAQLADNFVRDDRQVMRTGEPVVNRVELVGNADGSISWHITSKVLLHNKRGRVIGVAGFTRDMNKAGTSLKRYGSMSAAMEHISRKYSEPLKITDLAAFAHLSVSQFERRFKAVFQLTPVQYLVKFRINKASCLLRSSNTKITDIATACGFYDHSHFIRQFTKSVGVSPHAYRQTHL